MSNWQHAGFEAEATDAARLAGARAYLTELRSAITARISEDSYSYDPAEIGKEIARVESRVRELEQRVVMGRGPIRMRRR